MMCFGRGWAWRWGKLTFACVDGRTSLEKQWFGGVGVCRVAVEKRLGLETNHSLFCVEDEILENHIDMLRVGRDFFQNYIMR